jgi:hypothetical protein
MTLSITTLCYHDESRILFIFMLNVIILVVIMMIVIMLNVAMLTVMAPFCTDWLKILIQFIFLEPHPFVDGSAEPRLFVEKQLSYCQYCYSHIMTRMLESYYFMNVLNKGPTPFLIGPICKL